MFEFDVLKKDSKTRARTGLFHTPHGKLLTPELAFVATEGEIKSMPKEILPTLPVNLIIVNIFHLWVKDIIDKFKDSGVVANAPPQNDVILAIRQQAERPESISQSTIHNYANFQKPIMSDSGGFQVFSMGFGKAHNVGKIGGMFPGDKKQTIDARGWKLDKETRNLKLEKNQVSNFQPQNQASSLQYPASNDSNNPLKITEEGVEFEFNDQKILLTPEKSMEIQQKVGADIIFAFDECTSPLNSYKYTKKAMGRTHRWLKRCLRQLKKLQIPNSKYQTNSNNQNSKYKTFKSFDNSNFEHCLEFGACDLEFKKQALFAIVQGGYFKDLRKISAKYMAKFDVSGFGIGGSLGTTEDEVRDVLEWIIPYLPDEKPRHLLGIGKVRDIFDGVERGVDLFDCVIPTREARHKVLYTQKGKINVSKMKTVSEVVDENCPCQMCTNNITMKQLNNLFTLKDPQAFFYATVHNIQFFADLMKNIRNAIETNRLAILKEKYLRY